MGSERAAGPILRPVMTVREAAEVLGIGLNSAYEAIGRGEIPHIRIGRSIRVPRAALEQLLVGASQAEHHATD